MESQKDQMSSMMQSMQAELARVKAQPGQFQDLEEWVAAQKNAPPPLKESMVFFLGGYAKNDKDRTGDILTDANTDNSGTSLPTNVLTGNSRNGDNEGWYFGAGFDHHINDDLFGLMDDTDVLAEVMFEYKEFSSKDLRRAPLATAAGDSAGLGGAPVCGNLTPNGTPAGGPDLSGNGAYGSCGNSVTVTQFTLSAAPKIRFMKGSDFRPWIIPAGFAFHVISPPSDGVTVSTVGMMFAAGADYKVWKDVYIGVDARYHLVNNDSIDGVSIDGFTAGGYLGLGFN
jgi:opacity protein-like surface antigen